MSAIETALVSNTFLHSVMLSAASAAMGSLVVLMTKGATYISTRIKNEQMKATWTLASGYAEQVVQSVGQSFIAPMKATDNWNADTMKKASDMATQSLKNMLQAQAAAGAITLPATSAAHTIETVANTLVGSELHKLENQATAAIDKAVPAAAPVVNLVQQGLGQLADAHVIQIEQAIRSEIAQHLPSALGGHKPSAPAVAPTPAAAAPNPTAAPHAP